MLSNFVGKLRNFEMTFDELVVEAMKIKEIPIEEFDLAKVELLDFVEQRRRS